MSKYTEIRDLVIDQRLHPPPVPPRPAIPPPKRERRPVKARPVVTPSARPQSVRTVHYIDGKKLVITNSRRRAIRVVFKKAAITMPRLPGTGKTPGQWFKHIRQDQNSYREALLMLRHPDVKEIVLAVEFGT